MYFVAVFFWKNILLLIKDTCPVNQCTVAEAAVSYRLHLLCFFHWIKRPHRAMAYDCLDYVSRCSYNVKTLAAKPFPQNVRGKHVAAGL